MSERSGKRITNDTMLSAQIRYALNELKQIVAIYPEARYSLIGKTAILPDSLSKMVKVLKKHPCGHVEHARQLSDTTGLELEDALCSP